MVKLKSEITSTWLLGVMKVQDEVARDRIQLPSDISKGMQEEEFDGVNQALQQHEMFPNQISRVTEKDHPH